MVASAGPHLEVVRQMCVWGWYGKSRPKEKQLNWDMGRYSSRMVSKYRYKSQCGKLRKNMW